MNHVIHAGFSVLLLLPTRCWGDPGSVPLAQPVTVGAVDESTGGVPLTTSFVQPQVFSTSAAVGVQAVVQVVTTPPPSSTSPECKVLSGTTGLIVQVLLFLACCCALLAKYKRERSGRTCFEFILDSSKQLIGAGWIHVLNLFFAQQLEKHFEAGGDECHWYWINIVVDCTLGVLVEYLLLRCLTSYVATLCAGQAESLRTGEYIDEEDKFRCGRYVKQLLFWLFIVTLMKLCMVLVMLFAHSSLLAVSRIVLAPFVANASLTLLVVMICTPFVMNTFQFWMVDNFIKKQSSGGDSSDTVHEGAMKTRIQHGDL